MYSGKIIMGYLFVVWMKLNDEVEPQRSMCDKHEHHEFPVDPVIFAV